MKVRVFQDIELRTGASGTWVEAGDYEMIRSIGTKLLIILKSIGNKERVLTLVEWTEVDLINGESI